MSDIRLKHQLKIITIPVFIEIALVIPAMSENISYSLSQVVITYFINQISNEALAARTYCYNYTQTAFLIGLL